MEKLSVRDLEVKGRRVLVRVDFNEPTGGGASLELLEGKELPGVAALTDR